MRLITLVVFAVVTLGVFAALLSTILRAHLAAQRSGTAQGTLAAELIWAAIPCLIVIAAALPAAMLIQHGR